MRKVSADRIVIERLIIKYASQKHEANTFKRLAIPIFATALNASSVLADEGFRVQADLYPGHLMVIAAPDSIMHELEHHGDPIHAAHTIKEHFFDVLKRIKGKPVTTSTVVGDKIVDQIRAQLAEQGTPSIGELLAQTPSTIPSKNEGGGGSNKPNPPPPIKTVRG